MEARQIQRSSEFCAMAGLARYYARDCDNLEEVCEQVLSLIDLRWGLTDEERGWCIEILTDGNDGNRRPVDLIEHTHGILSVTEYSLLAQCLGWFASDENVMTSFLRDLSNLGLVISTTSDLFSDSVCDAFRLLEVPPTLNVSAIDQKYREWAKLLHPDSLVGVDLDRAEQEQAGRLLRDISNARDTIKSYLRSVLAAPMASRVR